MTFPTIEDLVHRFKKLDAIQIICKPLSENDNSKQQIYLGKSMQALSVLPYGEVTTTTGVKTPNFKAALRLKWIDSGGQVAEASGAQLILYPKYPEVRLSGFLRGCPIAPAKDLQPIPRGQRRFNNDADGRVLFLATTANGIVLAYLASAGSAVAREFDRRMRTHSLEPLGVFWQLPVLSIHAGRVALLARLRRIHRAGWHRSVRMRPDGSICTYTARNGGGYTLEALFEIRPNANTAPDFMGWELKVVARSRVTLMTPEPDAGYYAVRGAEYFVREYGRSLGDDSFYFTGAHSVGHACSRPINRAQQEPIMSITISVRSNWENRRISASSSARWPAGV
jgi:MvaI/BcnI restriction endonuclease family